MRRNVKFVKLASQPGFIYLLSAVGTDKFKIGRAANVANRIRELQTGCPLKIRYVYHSYVADASSIEVMLHRRFYSQREIGEWFFLTLAQVKECILLMRLVQKSESVQSDLAVFDEESKLDASKKLELAKSVIAQNLGKEKTIWLLWGIKSGGRNHQLYAEARVMLDRLIEDLQK